jgi:hypothetical protein
MKKYIQLSLILSFILTLALALSGCGSGGSNDNNITVTVNPGEVTMEPGDIQQFSATVTGTSNTAVIWSVDPQIGGGSLDPLHPGKYQAPLTVGTYYVVATSQADSTKFGKAKVNAVIGGYTVSGQVKVNSAVVGKNLFWAYQNDASDFTEDGKKLFINTVTYMIQ